MRRRDDDSLCDDDSLRTYATMTAYALSHLHNVWTGKRAKILVRKKDEPGGRVLE